jgi:topoisomerase-4 subunit A
MAKIYDSSDTILVGQNIAYIARYESSKIYTLLYFEGASKQYCLKRFNLESAPQTVEFSLLTENPDSSMLLFFDEEIPIAQIDGKDYDFSETTEVRGFRAIGAKLDFKRIKKAVKVPPLILG